MHSISFVGRTVSSRSSKYSQFDCRFIQSWRHVHRNQNISLFGKGNFIHHDYTHDSKTRINNRVNDLQLITTAGTFWMYSVFCACAAVFVVMVVPETKGRDLESIAKLFVKKRASSQRQPTIRVMSAVNKTNHNSTVNGSI